jgi:hypothetical protein
MKRFNLLLVTLIVSILISSCGNLAETDKTPVSATPAVLVADTFPVDPLFSDFYDYLGGMDTLGPAITPIHDSGDVKTQYLSSALLIYDPQASEGDHYRLASLGLFLGVAEPGIKNPPPSAVVVNGHIIDTKFLQAYENLGGEGIVGRPLTEARYNLDYGRYEQYFENLGFYIKTDDPDEEVYLLAYGAFACDRQCRYQPHQWSIPSQKPPLQEPFASAVANLGASIVGRTLTEPYISEDGKLEVIFENLVLILETEDHESLEQDVPPKAWLPLILAAGLDRIRGEEVELNFHLWMPLVRLTLPVSSIHEDMQLSMRMWLPIVVIESKDSGNNVKLRPIVEMVGIRRRPLVRDSEDPLMVFYSIENDRGHNVPIFFDGYIQQMGGVEVIGNPISEVYSIDGGRFRQCFENLCFDFDPNAPEGEQLKLAPLGRNYKKQYYDEMQGPIQTFSQEDLRMQVWESKTYVSSEDPQEIHVVITEHGVPVPALKPLIMITLPDNSQIMYHFPPTDEDGWSYLLIPPIPAPMGTLIAYEVCLPENEHDGICIGDNYLIWDIK